MQKIYPHLWFNNQAKEAAELYASIFPESSINSAVTLRNTPGGDCDIVTFKLWGHDFQAINGGPNFSFTPAISFMVNFDPSRMSDAAEKLEKMWHQLLEGGSEMMPLQEYPFSKKYGWVKDRYGLTWQLILSSPDGEARPTIMPSLLFVGDVAGKAEEATDCYLSVFQPSRRGQLARYPAGMEPDTEGTVMFTDFALFDQWFVAMDSAHQHDFTFNEAVSLVISCQTQQENDHYWRSLSAVPESEQCGWLKDRFGVSWQVVPADFQELMEKATPKQLDAMTQAVMPMKQIDSAAIKAAYAAAE